MSSIITSIDAFTHQGFTAPGTPNHYSEDRLVIAPSTFAVIDGATAATADQMGSLNTSAYTAQFLASFLARHDHTAHTAGDLLLMTNKQFAAHLAADWPHILHLGKLGPCAAVVVVRFHEHAITLASLADCAIAGLMEDGLWHLLSDPDTRHSALDDKLVATAQAEIAQGLTPQQARKAPAVVAMNEKHRKLMNIEYGVFNAEPEVATSPLTLPGARPWPCFQTVCCGRKVQHMLKPSPKPPGACTPRARAPITRPCRENMMVTPPSPTTHG